VLVGVYRAKRDAMLRGLTEVLQGTDAEISRPQGGFFVWIKLPAATNVAKLEELALQARVQYTPGRAFFAGKGGERHIRLAFSYEQPDKCYEGSRVLAKAILDAGRA
jgi:2-aminoadipate transaminase